MAEIDILSINNKKIQDVEARKDIQVIKENQINLIEDDTSMNGISDTNHDNLETTDKTIIGAINEVNSQFKDIANKIKDITTTGFSMIDVSSEDTYSVDTSSSGGGNTGETTVPVTGVTITGEKTSIKVGETLQLTANITPSNATNKKVEWTSTVVNYATVDSTGLVTAIAEGDVTIEATTEDGQFVARYNLTISAQQEPVQSGLILSLESDNYTENETTWNDNTSNLVATLSARVTKDSEKGLLFTGTENCEIDISSLEITGNDAFTLIVEHTPTDSTGTFGSLVGIFTENEETQKCLIEYRGFVSSDCISYLGQSRVKFAHNVNEKGIVGISFGEKDTLTRIGNNAGSIISNTNALDIPNILKSLKIAKSNNTSYYKGYIKSIKLYNYAMNDDEFKIALGVNN